MMNDGEGLLRAILEDPQDDLVRLVYADWLEENGEGDRAEFIRLQIEVSRSLCLLAEPGDDPHGCYCNNSLCDHCVADSKCQDLDGTRSHVLSGRTDRFSDIQRVWVGSILSDLVSGFSPDEWQFRRGLVSSIRLSLAIFLSHAGDLFAAYPIERVKLTDKRPLRYIDSTADGGLTTRWEWLNRHVDWYGGLTQEIHLLLTGTRSVDVGRFDTISCVEYCTEREADDDLSQACVTYGREKARLSKIDPTRLAELTKN